MKQALCILVLIGGSAGLSAGCGGAASVLEEVPPELRGTTAVVPAAADRHPYADPSGVDQGRWATYREGGRTFTLAVVDRGPDGTWIEHVEEGAASARLVAADGQVLKAIYQEAGGLPQLQALDQRASPPVPKRTEISRESGEEKIKAGAREFTAKRVKIVSEDLEGRRAEETWLWHPEVPPLYAGSDQGGLVRRVSAAGKVELLDFGTGAKPAVARP